MPKGRVEVVLVGCKGVEESDFHSFRAFVCGRKPSSKDQEYRGEIRLGLTVTPERDRDGDGEY